MLPNLETKSIAIEANAIVKVTGFNIELDFQRIHARQKNYLKPKTEPYPRTEVMKSAAITRTQLRQPNHANH